MVNTFADTSADRMKRKLALSMQKYTAAGFGKTRKYIQLIRLKHNPGWENKFKMHKKKAHGGGLIQILLIILLWGNIAMADDEVEIVDEKYLRSVWESAEDTTEAVDTKGFEQALEFVFVSVLVLTQLHST
ncbi:hypothetical protein SeLEV6574_g06454 [Synchytrium endobioticum]|uniref:Uncharacterized protein n=1 Tax=Synchytrium endobioticum TaxID=286115 RepID=A0A507CNL5_9FUNG|nr:hypothetical protein SeLEV6574_g06454 [Synchytrium endobioticum]